MAYEVEFNSPRVAKQFEDVVRASRPDTRQHLKDAIEALTMNPYPAAGRPIKKLEGGGWAIRAGISYRIVYEIHDRTVIITRVAHRREVYRK